MPMFGVLHIKKLKKKCSKQKKLAINKKCGNKRNIHINIRKNKNVWSKNWSQQNFYSHIYVDMDMDTNQKYH